MQSRTSSSSNLRSYSSSVKLAAAVLAVLGAWTGSSSAQVVVLSGSDAEIRETGPELTRGAVPTSGTQLGELQISTINGTPNRNLGLIRFTIPASITSSADLGGFADFRLFNRLNVNAGAGTSVRLYGLAPNHPLNTTWLEGEVMYRDAGIHQNPNPLIGGPQSNTTPSVLSQPSPGTPAGGAPLAPIAGAVGYGADANHARHAPGIRYENAPFSQQVQNENAARFTYNQTQRNAFLNNPGTELPYLSYINQPGYNVNTLALAAAVPVADAISVGDGNPATTGDGFTNIHNDVPDSNRPFFSGATGTWIDDLDAGVWTPLGFTSFAGTLPANASVQFTSGVGGQNTSPAQQALNLTALLAYLGAGLDDVADYHTFTFLIGPGIGQGGDIANTTNQQWASKEFIPASGANFSPQLILAPEPGTLSLLAIGATALLRRGRRR